jgi:hypothetical protein
MQIYKRCAACIHMNMLYRQIFKDSAKVAEVLEAELNAGHIVFKEHKITVAQS